MKEKIHKLLFKMKEKIRSFIFETLSAKQFATLVCGAVVLFFACVFIGLLTYPTFTVLFLLTLVVLVFGGVLGWLTYYHMVELHQSERRYKERLDRTRKDV